MKQIVITVVVLIAFFIVFPMVLAVVFMAARTIGLAWVNSVGWWWNYWLSLAL